MPAEGGVPGRPPGRFEPPAADTGARDGRGCEGLRDTRGALRRVLIDHEIVPKSQRRICSTVPRDEEFEIYQQILTTIKDVSVKGKKSIGNRTGRGCPPVDPILETALADPYYKSGGRIAEQRRQQKLIHDLPTLSDLNNAFHEDSQTGRPLAAAPAHLQAVEDLRV